MSINSDVYQEYIEDRKLPKSERAYWKKVRKAHEKFEKMRLALPYRQRNKLDAMILAANSASKERLRADAHTSNQGT